MVDEAGWVAKLGKRVQYAPDVLRAPSATIQHAASRAVLVLGVMAILVLPHYRHLNKKHTYAMSNTHANQQNASDSQANLKHVGVTESTAKKRFFVMGQADRDGTPGHTAIVLRQAAGNVVGIGTRCARC